LPGTAEECRQITTKLTAFAQQEPAVLTGDKATEAAFVDVYQPRVVVLATHGFFVEPAEPKEGQPSAAPENPLLRCGLALAGANQIGKRPAATHDGVLTGLEIVGVDLRGTELVVLSACETGLGDVKSGVGIAGLRQAFQLAGAQAVVSTLWKIPDQETAQLMTALWQSLADGKDKAAALTEAQRSLIAAHRKQDEKAAHPLYWAAFTLTGSWQPMPVGAARQRPPRAAPAPQVVVVSPAAEIMDGAKQVAKVAQGDRLTVAEKRGEWYLVRVPGMDKNGWILGRHVEALGE
jgi:CHAT domain-containing protein